MERSEKRAKLVSKIINNCRHELTIFSAKELIKILKLNKCPYSKEIFKVLKDLKLIRNVEHGRYEFVSQEPIYFGFLQKSLDKISKRQEEYVQRYHNKGSKESNISVQIFVSVENSLESFISDAIKLLKANGYKIQKPVTIYEEC